MDEPTASLGVKQSERLLDLTRSLPKQGVSTSHIECMTFSCCAIELWC
jgi:ABC-type sugar transport system ATPase subunit